jgi:hypothetical protein
MNRKTIDNVLCALLAFGVFMGLFKSWNATDPHDEIMGMLKAIFLLILLTWRTP